MPIYEPTNDPKPKGVDQQNLFIFTLPCMSQNDLQEFNRKYFIKEPPHRNMILTLKFGFLLQLIV